MMNRVTGVILMVIITAQASRVTIDEYGYSDLVVAISPDITSNHSQLIIENIQVWGDFKII